MNHEVVKPKAVRPKATTVEGESGARYINIQKNGGELGTVDHLIINTAEPQPVTLAEGE